MIVPLHLSKFERAVPSGAEWPLVSPDWVILQLCAGSAYALGGTANKDIPAFGVLVCPPKSSVKLMASVLGRAMFRGLSIRLSSLSGFMTVLERQCLETEVARQCAPYLLLGAEQPLARQVTHMFLNDNNMTLPNRLLLAQMFAELLAPQLVEAVNQGKQAENGQQDAKNRLRQLISQMPESELADLSLGEMAKMLHCCERHASRLFREVWGTGFLAYVSELRLKKSCHLLRQGKQKIIDIALESGFGSLAHFNYAFRKRFGMTPTEWREQNTPPQRRPSRPKPLAMAALLIFLLAIGLSAVGAATGIEKMGNAPTNSATATNQSAAAARLFKVDRYEVTGNTLLSTDLMTRVLSPYTGEAVTVDTVIKAQGALQVEYRDRGYVTVAVRVPPQPVTNGVITLAVTEGTLGEIRVIHNHYFSSNNVMRNMPGLEAMSGGILNTKLFQAELDRANANPDRQVFPEVRSGAETGTSALVLDVKDRLPLHGKLEFDDYSPAGTPAERLNANLTYGNLWQLDHTVGVQYGFSPDRMKDGLDVPHMSLSPMDGPQIAYYSGFYRAPLGPPESVASQISQEPGNFGFNEATRQFVVPPSTGRPELIGYVSRSTTGNPLQAGPLEDVVSSTNNPLLGIQQQAFSQQFTTETTAGGRFTFPLRSWGGIQSSVSFGADYKYDEEVTLATNFFHTTSRITNTGGQVVVRRDTIPVIGNTFPSLHYAPFFFGWTGSRPDKWGQFNGSVSAILGMGGVFSRLNEFPAEIAQSKQATTEFAVLRPQLSRSQKLVQGFTLYGNVTGQWANEPLLNLEQLAVGGVSSVRGYHEGERYADTGLTMQGELRSPTYGLGEGKPVGVQLIGFTDYGEGYLLDPAAGQKAGQALWGAGAGLNFSFGPRVESHISIAWPLMDSAFTRAGRERVLFSVSAQL